MKRMKWLSLGLLALVALFVAVPLSSQAYDAGGGAAVVEAVEVAPTTIDVRPNDAPMTQPDVKYVVYVVKRGDTLSSIAARYNCTVWAIMKVNRIKNANRIYVGQRLWIPVAGTGTWTGSSGNSGSSSDLKLAVCNPSVAISWPRNHEAISSDSLEIKGAVGLPSGFDPGSNGFSYYKVEWGVGERPILWNGVGALHYNTVPDGWLETWNTSVLANGIYTLRLFAVSTRGQFPEPCVVRVEVKR